MLLVENSRLLEALGINERESAGEVTYDATAAVTHRLSEMLGTWFGALATT